MPLGMEVGLVPGDAVLDGDPHPPWKGAQQPHSTLRPTLLWDRSPISASAEILFVFILFNTFPLIGECVVLLC